MSLERAWKEDGSLQSVLRSEGALTAESEPLFSIADYADWMKAPLYRTEAYDIPETIGKLIKPYEHGS